MRLGIKLIDAVRGTDILQKYEILTKQTKATVNLNSSDQLINLLLTLKKYNQYYKPLLQKHSDKEITIQPFQVLSTLPLMDKVIINHNKNLIYTAIEGRKVQQKKTGGSTGNPFYYFVDKEHLSWFWAHIYFFWNRYTGYRPGDPFITIAGNSLRTTNRRISENFYHQAQNNYFIKGDVIDKNLSINFSKTNKSVLLYGYPSSIVNILKLQPQLTKNLHKLKAVFTTSEQLLPHIRLQIEQALHVPVFDMYGANDGGILSCECEKHNGYHINAQNCLVESFENEHGLSELLLTNLISYSFPFVRYRVGDIGKVTNEPCSCGLPGPRIQELSGRTRDMILLPDGKNIHGSFFNQIFYKYPDVDGYKILQKEDRSIIVYIHLDKTQNFDAVSTQITHEIRNSLGDISLSTEMMTELNPTNEKFKLIESHAI
jgi:phenylacetate-CoA ligase